MRKPESMYVRGKCVECKEREQMPKGGGKFRSICRKCAELRYNVNRAKRINQKEKKDRCEMCGFVAAHPCQLDIDHKDGDNSNNAPENRQTLCANCHRLKTFKCRDWETR